MSPAFRVAAISVAALAMACSASARGDRDTDGGTPLAIDAGSASAPDARDGGDPRGANAARDGGPTRAPTEVELALSTARIEELTLEVGSVGREGLFAALLSGPGVEAPGRALVRLALRDAPIAHQRRLAFHRLASALEAHVVPAGVERALSFAELGAALADQPRALTLVRQQAAVRNDGTVAALWTTVAPRGDGAFRPPGGATLDPYAGGEPARWARWAASPERKPDEQPTIVRAYVEMLALDYVAATTRRRSVFVVRAADGAAVNLVLFDNAYAFPLAPAIDAMSANLRRLKAIQRFPRRLRDGLAALTPARAKELLQPGGFETWLVPPRTLVEMEERRAALLSLIEAKIALGGESKVLAAELD